MQFKFKTISGNPLIFVVRLGCMDIPLYISGNLQRTRSFVDSYLLSWLTKPFNSDLHLQERAVSVKSEFFPL